MVIFLTKIQVKMDINYSIKRSLEAIDKIEKHNEIGGVYHQDITGYLVALQILTNLDNRKFFIPQLRDKDLNFNVYRWVDYKKIQEMITEFSTK